MVTSFYEPPSSGGSAQKQYWLLASPFQWQFVKMEWRKWSGKTNHHLLLDWEKPISLWNKGWTLQRRIKCQTVYQRFCGAACRTPLLYRVPNVHKPGHPLLPIVSSPIYRGYHNMCPTFSPLGLVPLHLQSVKNVCRHPCNPDTGTGRVFDIIWCYFTCYQHPHK